MKRLSILSTLAKTMLPFVVLMSTLSTQAQTSPEGHYRTDNGLIIMNLLACKEDPCELQYQYARVKVSGIVIDENRGLQVGSKALKITSNLPIGQIASRSQVFEPRQAAGKAVVKICGGGNSIWQSIGTKEANIKELTFETASAGYCYFHESRVAQIALVVGGSISIAEDMKGGTVSLISAYQAITEHLSDFREIVARDSSDARHLTRLENQLRATLKLMVDEKGNPLLPVTHRKITEGSRIIMVLSTVLEEILVKYNFESKHLQGLKPAREALAKLSSELRKAYGWEEGLAGSGSKALAALSSILDTELRNMYSQMAAFNSDASVAQTFNALFRANSTLYNKVAASNAGDVAGADAARELLSQWNSSAWQKILSTMMTAPREAQASIQNRILMALTAIESIKDYVDPKGESRTSVDVPADVRAKLP